MASTTSPTRAFSGSPSSDRRQLAFGFDLDDGQVGFRIGPDDFCRRRCGHRPGRLRSRRHLPPRGCWSGYSRRALTITPEPRLAHLAFLGGTLSPKKRRSCSCSFSSGGTLGQRLAGEDIDHGRHRARGSIAVAGAFRPRDWCRLQHRHRPGIDPVRRHPWAARRATHAGRTLAITRHTARKRSVTVCANSSHRRRIGLRA